MKVTNVEVKQVDLPETMLRAMAKQAEAEREKRSKIIHAEGEFAAAQRLADAAHVLATEPPASSCVIADLTEIGVEKNTTMIFPVPVDFFSGIQELLNKTDGDKKLVSGSDHDVLRDKTSWFPNRQQSHWAQARCCCFSSGWRRCARCSSEWDTLWVGTPRSPTAIPGRQTQIPARHGGRG